MLDFLQMSTSKLVAPVDTWWPSLVSAVVVMIIAYIFYAITSRIFESALNKTHMRRSLVKITVHSLYKGAIGVIGFIFVLGQMGIDVTAALAGVGIGGIALAFAAKETLSNVMSGFGIYIDDLYRTGDWVEIVGQYGQVKDITLRTTKIRTLDNVFIILPNSKVTLEPVTNYSEEGMVRITIKLSISYQESIDEVRTVLLAALKEIEGVNEEPEPAVVIDSLGDSGMEIFVRVWVDDPGADKRFRFLITETCKKALDNAGIEIPYPHREVYMHQV